MSDQDDIEKVQRLLALAGKENGEEKERKRWRFNGEFNLGHVFTILSIIGGAALFWSTSQLKQQDHEFRIVALEQASRDFKIEMARANQQTSDAINKLVDTQAQGMRNQDKLAVTLDFLAKQQANK